MVCLEKCFYRVIVGMEVKLAYQEEGGEGIEAVGVQTVYFMKFDRKGSVLDQGFGMFTNLFKSECVCFKTDRLLILSVCIKRKKLFSFTTEKCIKNLKSIYIFDLKDKLSLRVKSNSFAFCCLFYFSLYRLLFPLLFIK